MTNSLTINKTNQQPQQPRNETTKRQPNQTEHPPTESVG